jgi:hypothetical protein
MIRTKLGISKIAVSPEIDPGFGPDTEQRRVEFAAKLEQEAFYIAVGDAAKLAKANLVTALKLWEREDLIPLIEKFDLRDIMIIWLFFELVYISRSLSITSKKLGKVFKKDIKKFKKYIFLLFEPIFSDIPDMIYKSNINQTQIKKLREEFGGDLLFALKAKNDNEIIKVYEMTFSKLPKSLRDEFFSIITGVDISYEQVLKIWQKGKEDLILKLATVATAELAKVKKYAEDKKLLRNISKIVEIFDKRIDDVFLDVHKDYSTGKQKEVEDMVKRYYGIGEK